MTIIDDDKPSPFAFACPEYNFAEDCGTAKIKIWNTKGVPGKVRVVSIDGGATGGNDFETVD